MSTAHRQFYLSDIGLPDDLPRVKENSQWYVYIPDVECEYLWYTSSFARVDGRTVRLMYVLGDTLYYWSEEGSLASWNTYTGYHYLVVPYVQYNMSMHITDDQLKDRQENAPKLKLFRFDFPALIWNICLQQLGVDQIIRGLKSQFDLTGVKAEHEFSVNKYRFEIEGDTMALSDVMWHVVNSLNKESEDGVAGTIGA